MARFPEPPPINDLIALGPDRHTLHPTDLLWRLYPQAGKHPRAWNTFRSFGPVTSMRFDHHLDPPREQGRKILYAGTTIEGCVAEYFQSSRTIDRFTDEPWLVGFWVERDVTLLNLRDEWPTSAGASQEINSGQRGRARRWSRAIYDAYPDIEGLWYRSSMWRGRPAVAFYERAQAALTVAPFSHLPLSAPGLFAPLAYLARRLDWALV